jgi:hypothetical protein
MSTNLDLLISAGLIQSNNLPNATDIATINSLDQTEVEGLISICSTVGTSFLTNNCNPGGSVGPGPGVRTIGIVF